MVRLGGERQSKWDQEIQNMILSLALKHCPSIQKSSVLTTNNTPTLPPLPTLLFQAFGYTCEDSNSHATKLYSY